MGNVQDRRAGFIYALLCGLFCFVPCLLNLFNYLPRIFLGIMLFFAGTGFVVENLWNSWKLLSMSEWLVVLTISFIFITTQSLLYAVIIGCAITGFSFIVTYARVPCVVNAQAVSYPWLSAVLCLLNGSLTRQWTE